MMGALADILLGPLLWLIGGLLTAVGVWWAATSRANAKANTDRAEEALRRAEHENAIRKDIQDAIKKSKSGTAAGDGWHKRLSDNAAKHGGDL